VKGGHHHWQCRTTGYDRRTGDLSEIISLLDSGVF
jgi:hypothetical protein